MAWNPNLYAYEDDYMRQREKYDREKQRHLGQLAQQNMYGNAIGNQLGAARQAEAPKPVPTPEPNKVLLLLGEDA